MRGGRSPKRSSLLRTSLAGGSGSFLFVAVLVLSVRAARGPLDAASAELAHQRPLPLVVGGVCALVVPAATAAAWRSILTSCGEELAFREAWGCYGLGCLANAVLPAKLGEALRVESFARRSRHGRRRWFVSGVSATVALGQSVVFAGVVTLGAVGGALPIWAAASAVALPVVAGIAAAIAVRAREDGRLSCLATAASLSPAAWARAVGWIAASSVARLLTAAAVLAALSTPHPIAGAFVTIGARALGGAVPFAPGGGVGAAAVAIGLTRTGLDPGTALAAAVSFHALETVASLLFGSTGWLLLRLGPRTAGSRGAALPAPAVAQ